MSLAVFAGCSGPEFGGVTGRVTLDGKPLVEGTVEFQPDNGSPAYGVTDEQGKYELQWTGDQGGAPVGTNKVRITSFQESKPGVKERVPEKFNKKTELIREVGPGRQEMNFDLESK